MPTQILDYFSNLVADDSSIPLTEAALSIAQDAYPDLDIQTTLAEIDALVLKLNSRIAPGTTSLKKLHLLNNFFYSSDELGFKAHTNDYYDPDHTYLNIVLKSRCGIAISLAILYMEIGQQIGLPLRGMPFPNHFLVRMTISEGEVFVDPLTGESLTNGKLQSMLAPYAEEQPDQPVPPALRLLLQDAGSREILAYMLRNLKDAYLQDERWERLLAVQQRLVILLPHAIEEVRDRGLAYAKLEYFRLARADFETYLQQGTDAKDALALRNYLSQMQQKSRQALS